MRERRSWPLRTRWAAVMTGPSRCVRTWTSPPPSCLASTCSSLLLTSVTSTTTFSWRSILSHCTRMVCHLRPSECQNKTCRSTSACLAEYDPLLARKPKRC
eukprot:Rmarinus@m.11494